jgi:hypothetical protein
VTSFGGADNGADSVKVDGHPVDATRVETTVGRASLRGLVQNVLVLATALAAEGHAGLTGVAGQFRALAVQLAYRTVNRQALVVPGRSVLLWSVVHRGATPRRSSPLSALRRLRALVAALGVATLSTVVPVAGVVTVLQRLLELLPMGDLLATKAAMLVVAPSVAATGVRAAAAYRVERRRARRIPFAPGYAVWRLDLLGAPDRGQGFGGQVLDEFLRRATRERAHVYLLTQPGGVSFYARHGLTPLVPAYPDGMVLMRRLPGAPLPLASLRAAPGARS